MALGNTMKKVALRTAFDYIEKNPEENMPKLMDWVDRFAGNGPDSFPVQRAAMRKVIEEPENNMYQLVMRIMKDTDSDVLKATFENFFLHINANGDVDPCVFIHYSNANIRDMTLLEALKSPIFMAYHDGQPFNENHLRPCPMLENPKMLREMVEKTGAHSTDIQSPESAEHLCSKCDAYAKCWTPTAEKLWEESRQK